jgi:NADPH:quinone reductase-like Zn-dependent oxidoreductase
MRALSLTEHGRPPVVIERPEPSPEPGRVLVDVTTAPLTPLDVLVASGTSYFGPPALPYVPGVQGVGRLVDDPQQRVWFTTSAGMQPGDGSMAQRVAVDPERTMTLRHDIPDELVAALGLSAVAADGALRRGRFSADDRVVVLGAGGVVGQVAVALAAARGAAAVVAVCRGGESTARAERLGAGAAIDSSLIEQHELTEALLAAVPDGPTLVVDPVWGAPAAAALASLAPRGRLVNLGDSADSTLTLASALVRSRLVEILGYSNLSLTWTEQVTALDEVLAIAAAGRLDVNTRLVDPASLPGAWRDYANGVVRGRVVVDFRG